MDAKEALLKEIIEWDDVFYPPSELGDVTLRDYAAAIGREITTARRRLDKMVVDGKLIKLKVDNGKWVYRKPLDKK